MKLIDKAAVVTEIRKLQKRYSKCRTHNGYEEGLKEGRLIGYKDALHKLDTLEVKEVDVEKESELIANGIMISVQANKYGTNIYNTERNDFNHHHLQMAARKGIELGLKAPKGE
jgi:hypothetical protein